MKLDSLHTECLAMIKRRCRQAGMENTALLYNHTFQGTDITAYSGLEHYITGSRSIEHRSGSISSIKSSNFSHPLISI